MSKLPIFAVAAGVLLGVGAIALARTSASRADQKPTTAGSTSLAAADAPPSEVHVKLTTSPANATIKLDGVTVPSPYDARLPRDAREHTINVEAAGYEPRVEKVKLESDVVMVLTLTKPAGKPTQAPQAALQPPPSKWTPAPKQTPTAPPSAATAAPAVTPTPPPTPTPTPSATQHQGGNGKVPKPDIDKGDPWGGGR